LKDASCCWRKNEGKNYLNSHHVPGYLGRLVSGTPGLNFFPSERWPWRSGEGGKGTPTITAGAHCHPSTSPAYDGAQGAPGSHTNRVKGLVRTERRNGVCGGGLDWALHGYWGVGGGAGRGGGGQWGSVCTDRHWTQWGTGPTEGWTAGQVVQQRT
jgi:hypothetical protein